MRILFVDDEEQILRAVGRSLQDEGFELHFTTDARDALDLIALQRIDVLVCDQRMPKVLGISLLARARIRYPHVVRMLMTAHLDVETAVRAVNECNVLRIIEKPWTGAQLRAIFHDVERGLRQRSVDEAWRSLRRIEWAPR